MGKITVKDADEVPKKRRSKASKKPSGTVTKKSVSKKPSKKINIVVQQASSEDAPVPVAHEEDVIIDNHEPEPAISDDTQLLSETGKPTGLMVEESALAQSSGDSEATEISGEPSKEQAEDNSITVDSNEKGADTEKIEAQLAAAVEKAVEVANNHTVNNDQPITVETSDTDDGQSNEGPEQPKTEPKGIAAYKPIVFTPAPAPEIQAPVEVTLPEPEESVVRSVQKPSRSKVSKKLLLLACLGLVFGAVLIALLAPTRNFVLNMAGVTGKISIKVVDSETKLPIKNAVLAHGTQVYKTDKDGNALLSNLRLGKSTIEVKKTAFATTVKNVDIPFSGAATEQIAITPNGKKIKLKLVDYVGDKTISGAEVTAKDFAAYSDRNGIVSLAVDANAGAPIEVTVQAVGYREEVVTLQSISTDEVRLELVTLQKHYFVSNNSGRYDITSIDVDGKNRQTVLAGTGAEKEDTHIVQQQSGQQLALITSRSGLVQSTGVYIYNVSKSQLKLLNGADRARIIGWVNDWLVYSYIDPSKPKNSPEKEQIIAYNSKNEAKNLLASANYFNDIALLGSSILYAPSSSQLGAAKAKLYEVEPSKKSTKTIIDQEVWKISWKDQNTIVASGGKDHFEYKYKTGGTAKSATANSRISNLTLSPNLQQAVYIDDSSGSKKLMLAGNGIQNKSVLVDSTALSLPVRWLSGGHIVFRQTTASGAADYVIASSGGTPKKIANVAATGLLDDWYFH